MFETGSAVIATSSCNEAVQTVSAERFLDCFAPLAMTEDPVTTCLKRQPHVVLRQRRHADRVVIDVHQVV